MMVVEEGGDHRGRVMVEARRMIQVEGNGVRGTYESCNKRKFAMNNVFWYLCTVKRYKKKSCQK